MARILVTEKIAERGLDLLRSAGHEVDVQLDLTPETLLDAVRGAHALIIRSATTVSADVIAAGVGLMVVGRAGIGLDNVDVDAATRHGVLVANAPQSNTLSAAEHTMALLLSQARNVPQAHRALKEGRWERSQWTGVEVAEKTLGVVGLGQIGRLVAQRAAAFGMRLVAFDPFVSDDVARSIGVELMDLEELVATADFLTIHVARTPETTGMISAELLAKAKPNLRLINVARGGIVDEAALAAAISNGTIAGAAIDVFSTEPCTDSPLFELPQVVVTPHLGASTAEAQDKAGVTIAEQVGLALAGDFVPFAVNVSAAEASEIVRPFLPWAEQLGAMFGGYVETLPDEIHMEFAGEIGGYNNQITALAVMKGALGTAVDKQVSYVNAHDVAKEQGVTFTTSTTTESADYRSLITVRGAGHAMAGRLSGLNGAPRLVMVDDHKLEVPPAPNMLFVRNDDRPGVIGAIGVILGETGVNIADMNVGVRATGEAALMIISTDKTPAIEVVERLRAIAGVHSVVAVALNL